MSLEGDAKDEILRILDQGKVSGEYIPTGLIEPAIVTVGNVDRRTVVNMQICNKAGKTGGAACIARNIFWPYDKGYYDYPAYRDWPFKNVDGNTIKRARFIGTKENVQENGPIFTEIRKWWPPGKWDPKKLSHAYFKQVLTDTGWEIDVMSNEQKDEEYEGPLCSFIWIDEPVRPKILDACLRRFSKGGVLLLTQTPINAGPMLDVLDDLAAQGTNIVTITGSIYENDIDTGKPNSKGTRRGLMTAKEIEEYAAGVMEENREAALFGRASHKSGKVYKTFERAVHAGRDYDLGSAYAKSWNNYMIMDPHRAFYPFMMWLGITPEEDVVVWNEWPTYRTMKNNFYDQIRMVEHCPFGPAELAGVMRVFDMTAQGMQAPRKRFIDPQFAKGTQNEWTKSTQGIVEEYAKQGIHFDMPPVERIDTQKVRIQALLKYDANRPTGVDNWPRLYVMPHCVNTIRAFERHYYEEGTENEAEEYKEPPDCLRYGLAGMGEIVYREEKKLLPSQMARSADVRKVVAAKDKYSDEMKGVEQ